MIPRPVVLFFALAYAIAWGLWLVLGWAAGESGVAADDFVRMVEAQRFEGTEPALPGWLLYLISRLIDFSFSISGVVVIGLTAGIAGLRRLGDRLVRWRFAIGWYLVALLPVYLFAISVVLAGATPVVELETVGAALFGLESGLLVSLFLRGAMGEELGLRGFALPSLQERMSPFTASLVIGVLWGLWHLPVLVTRAPASIVLFLVLVVGLSFLFTLMFNGSGGSLIPGLILHATQNWEEGFEALFPALVGTEWETPSTLLLLALGLAAGVVLRVRGGPRAVAG